MAEPQASKQHTKHSIWVVCAGANEIDVGGVEEGWHGAQLARHIKEQRHIKYDEADLFLDLPTGAVPQLKAYAKDDTRTLNPKQELDSDFFDLLRDKTIEVRLRPGAVPLAAQPPGVNERILRHTSASQAAFDELMGAVTVYVKFNGNVSNVCDGTVAKASPNADTTVAKASSRAIAVALLGTGVSTADDKPDSAAEVVRLLHTRAPGRKFFFVFDEVQSFEKRAKLSATDGVLDLYAFWQFAEELRTAGHFYVLCGRSKFLYLIGQSHCPFPDRPETVRSPNVTRVINLNVFTDEGIREYFDAMGLHSWTCSIGIHYIRRLTAGVPRILYFVVPYLRDKFPNAVSTKAEAKAAVFDINLLELLQSNLDTDFVVHAKTQEEQHVLETLHDLAWSEMPVHRPHTQINNRNISSVLAWAGYYNGYAGPWSSGDMVVVCVPQFKKQHRFSGCLASLGTEQSTGDRLEAASYHVLRLRARITDNLNSFAALGLHALDSKRLGLKFPAGFRVCCAGSLPKFSSESSSSLKELRAFMSDLHKAMDRDVTINSLPELQATKVVFPPELLPELYSLLRPGFKNTLPPFKTTDLAPEVMKLLPPWSRTIHGSVNVKAIDISKKQDKFYNGKYKGHVVKIQVVVNIRASPWTFKGCMRGFTTT
eukprot:m51a1_g9347 hypothetical protein (653) ;mRNA; r:88628-111760